VRFASYGAQLRLPCTPPPKLGEGSTDVARNEQKEVGGEGSRRSARPSALHRQFRTFVSPRTARCASDGARRARPLPRPLPARSSRRGENSRAHPADGVRLGLPCTPPPKLGEGSTASRGTSEQAVGGEGSRRSARQSALHRLLRTLVFPANIARSGENSRADPADGVRLGLPCTPPPKLGEGSTASRGTSEQAVGGEGSRRSPRQSALHRQLRPPDPGLPPQEFSPVGWPRCSSGAGPPRTAVSTLGARSSRKACCRNAASTPPAIGPTQ
jgi:hypothetical protein